MCHLNPEHYPYDFQQLRIEIKVCVSCPMRCPASQFLSMRCPASPFPGQLGPALRNFFRVSMHTQRQIKAMDTSNLQRDVFRVDGHVCGVGLG